MSLFKTAFTSTALLAGGLVVAAPQDADAQTRFSVGSGHGYGYGSAYQSGHDHGSGYRQSSVYGNGYNNYGGYDSRYSGYSRSGGFSGGRGYGAPVNRGWHETSHYDYQPTTVTPHRGHLDVNPGHYDYHRSGHGH